MHLLKEENWSIRAIHEGLTVTCKIVPIQWCNNHVILIRNHEDINK